MAGTGNSVARFIQGGCEWFPQYATPPTYKRMKAGNVMSDPTAVESILTVQYGGTNLVDLVIAPSGYLALCVSALGDDDVEAPARLVEVARFRDETSPDHALAVILALMGGEFVAGNDWFVETMEQISQDEADDQARRREIEGQEALQV